MVFVFPSCVQLILIATPWVVKKLEEKTERGHYFTGQSIGLNKAGLHLVLQVTFTGEQVGGPEQQLKGLLRPSGHQCWPFLSSLWHPQLSETHF